MGFGVGAGSGETKRETGVRGNRACGGGNVACIHLCLCAGAACLGLSPRSFGLSFGQR